MSEQPQTHPKAKGHHDEAQENTNTHPHAKAEPKVAQPDELERLKTEAQQAKEQYLRTLADFENTKKRLHREKEEFIRFASETMVRELLPIVDSLDQALVAVDKQADPQAIIKGVHLIYRQLLGLLLKEGVVRIPTVGELFDPHKHEAVAQVETTDETPEHTVVEEVQVGYTMHGKVLRPAMVKVATHAVDCGPQTTDDSKAKPTQAPPDTTTEHHA